MTQTPDRSLRVLMVLPMYGGSLPVGRNCAAALAQLGHTVESFEAPAFHAAYEALKDLRVTSDRLEALENQFLGVVSQAVLAKVESFGPDLVLAVAQAPLSIPVLKKLRSQGVPTAMWFVEDFRLFTYWRVFAEHYDAFAVIQKEPFLSELKALGVANALYLPLAAMPELHRPLDLGSVEKRKYGAPVSFLGAGYPNRRLAFRRLAGRGLKIWGSDWEGDEALKPLVQRGGARIDPDECVFIYNATDVNLNLHSSVSAKALVSPGDFVNPRTFELAACGAFQLVDRRALLPELFDLGAPDSGGELATFETFEELVGLLDHYLAHPDQRRAMAERARARVLAEHTYAHRMQALLGFLHERLEGWPKERTGPSVAQAAALDALDADLRPQLAALLDALELTPDAPFADLIWRLRSRKGELTPLETALLFLDEWQKQQGGA